MIRTDSQSPPTPKDRRSRRSAIRAVTFLVVALCCAVFAAVLFTRYMDARTAALRVPTDKVVVAAVDIPVAVPIKAEWLTTIDWPKISRPEAALADPAGLVGKIATTGIAKGEAVLPTKLASADGHGGLAALLTNGARAVSVRVDDVVGVAGFIHPGDRVDVIATLQPRTTDGLFASKIILQNVRVLAVGQDLQHRGRDADRAAPATVATLQVSPEESEALALAANRGKLLLALRGAADEEVAETHGMIPQALLARVDPETPRPQPVAAAPSRPKRRDSRRREAVAQATAPQPAPKERQVVEILRGDLFEKRDFEKAEKRP